LQVTNLRWLIEGSGKEARDESLLFRPGRIQQDVISLPEIIFRHMAPASPGNAVCYLFVDTETTGTFRFGRPPPRLVEVAWLVCEVSGEVVERGERIVRPDDFTVPAGASRIHGITTGYARRAGVSVLEALEALCLAASRSSTVVAHNLRFDRAVIAEECRRNGVPDPLSNLPGICTMESTASVCRIRRVGGGGYKWPALSELYRSLFGVTYERSVHRAADDVEACARCFFALKEQGFWE